MDSIGSWLRTERKRIGASQQTLAVCMDWRSLIQAWSRAQVKACSCWLGKWSTLPVIGRAKAILNCSS